MTALRLDKILAPTDLSPLAEAAVQYAHGLAERFGAELHVLHVAVDFDEAAKLHGATGVIDASAGADAYDQWLAALLGEAGNVRRVEVVRVTADVAGSICQYAHSEAIDLIVMATHGRSALTHLFMGSVTENVLRAAPCPAPDHAVQTRGERAMSAGLDLRLDYLPRLPQRRDWRIGCIGAGFIMRDCHLVAYRQAGFNPVAIAARRPEQAAEVATLHHIPHVHAGVDDLLADPNIEILDIAVPPDRQAEIILRATASMKGLRGILAQKPLALSVQDARACVEACARAGIALAVNQNMRYDQSVRALRDVLNRGWLGTPVLGTIDMRAIPHWMPWSEALPSLATFVMSIHHLDTFRYWFGTPDRVLASTRPDPRTKFPHTDGINLYILEYDTGVRAASWDDVWTGPAREGSESDIGIRWRVEGTDGLARGTIGWPSYPARTPSTLDFTTKEQPGYWLSPRWNEVWFPDAFVGTMAQLLCAVEDGTEPEISGRDNLETIALCEAVFAAARDHRVTTVREFLTPLAG